MWIIPGNVDSASIMQNLAGDNIKFVDAKIIDYEGYKFGFAGGEFQHRLMLEVN